MNNFKTILFLFGECFKNKIEININIVTGYNIENVIFTIIRFKMLGMHNRCFGNCPDIHY